ncbi:MAG: phosphatidate cytidylyltransferase, partial [Gemmatimonadota bacterium]
VLAGAADRVRPLPHRDVLWPLGHGFLQTVVGPVFVVGVASLPEPVHVPGTRLGWLVLLLFLTELNDIAQAWWGKALGRRPLAPVLSPRKTWAGFGGGMLTTAAAAVLVAPYLTDWGRAAPPAVAALTGATAHGVPGGSGAADPAAVAVWIWPALLGVLVSVAGLLGDLSASALKRRAGVKDSGELLPGHGGVLDRLDSLALAAPVFFFLTWLLWFRP